MARGLSVAGGPDVDAVGTSPARAVRRSGAAPGQAAIRQALGQGLPGQGGLEEGGLPPELTGPGSSRSVSHNLNGQRLGRKGHDTRERILAATRDLLAAEEDAPISLSAVARQASLALTSLYLYFTDLTELLLAILDPLAADAEESYLRHLRDRWPDDALPAHCSAFVTAIHGFWHRHSTILHLRNSMADQRDRRMMAQRVHAAQPVISMLVMQMDAEPGIPGTTASGMATALFTGVDRMVTVATDRVLPTVVPGPFAPDVPNLLRAEALLLEMGISRMRAAR